MVDEIEDVRVVNSLDTSSIESADHNLVKVAKDGGILLVGKIFTNACRFVTAFLLARLLGAQNYGLYLLSLNLATLLAALVELGFDTALVRFVAISVSRKNEKRTWGTLQIGIGIPLLLSILISTGLYALAYPLSERIFHDKSLAPLLQIVSVVVPFSVLGDTLIGATRGFKNMRYPVLAKFIAQPFVKLILIGITAFLGLRTIYAVAIFGIGEFVAAVILLFYLHRLFSVTRSPLAAEWPLKEILTFSFPEWLGNLLDTFRGNIETLLIGSLGSIAGVGIFSVADQINVIGHDFYTSLNTSAKPFFAELHERGDRVQLESIYQATAKWALIVNLPFFLGLVLYPASVMSIFGKTFIAGATALVLMAFANIADVGTGMCGAMLNMTGYTRLKFINTIVSLLLSAGLNIYLIPKYGVIGAAISALTGLVTLNVMRILEVYFLMKIFPYNANFLKPVLAAGIVFVAGYLLNRVFPVGENIIYLGVAWTLIFVLFTTLILLFGLAPEDRLLLSRVNNRWFNFIKRFSRK